MSDRRLTRGTGPHGRHQTRRAVGRRGALRIVAVALLALAAIQPMVAAAAPGRDTTRPVTAAVIIGGGSYAVTASVFGSEADGLVGQMTASGHILQARDHLVALPSCTASSCPWLAPGTGPEAEWGPQESCAEPDDLCWVEVTSPETGACTVAPVLDLGPLFIKDNWWAPFERRTYTLDQGVPAAEAAAKGADLGYGPGMSDKGHDIANDFAFAAGIDLAAGTWIDLGLDPRQGIAPMHVRMLWQAQIMHTEACDGTGGDVPIADPGTEPVPTAVPGTEPVPTEAPPTGETPENAATTDDVNLRAGPGIDTGVLEVIPAGDRLAVTGPAESGFYTVTHGDRAGWAFGDFLALDGPGDGATAFTTDDLNLRAGPSAADAILQVMPAGRGVRLTGEAQDGWVAVEFDGTAGWAYAAFLDAGGGAVPGADQATVTSELNLRSGPSTADPVLGVMPAGATVMLTGEEENGFRGVRYGDLEGWAFNDWLTVEGGTTAVTTDAVNLRAGPSLGDEVLVELPAGTQVDLTGKTMNGFQSVQSGTTDGWLFATYLD